MKKFLGPKTAIVDLYDYIKVQRDLCAVDRWVFRDKQVLWAVIEGRVKREYKEVVVRLHAGDSPAQATAFMRERRSAGISDVR